MSTANVLDFLRELFTAIGTMDSLIILGFLFGAFLIGWLFGRWSRGGQLRRMRRQLKEKENEVVSLQAKSDALLHQIEQHVNDLQTAKLEMEEMQNAAEQLEMEKTRLQGELNIAKDYIGELQSRNAGYAGQIEELNREIQHLTEQGSESDEEEELAIEIGGYQEVATLQNNYQNTIERLSAIEDKLLLLEQENSQLKDEISQVRSTAELVEEILPADDDFEISADQRAEQGRLAIQNALGKQLPKASNSEKDALQHIEGIGPFLEEKLNEVGIYTYQQISQLNDELIEKLTDAIRFFPGRIRRDNWVGQAKGLMKRA